MKKWLGISLICAALIFGGIWIYSATWTPSVTPWVPTLVASTTEQLYIAKYTTVPAQFTWTEEDVKQLGISFERPSFWNFQSAMPDYGIGFGYGYGASFDRSAVVDASGTAEAQKYDLSLVLDVGYDPIILGMNHGYLATPEEYLDSYFPVTTSSPYGFRKTIGNINLIKSGDRYTFFTKDKVIQFITHNASDAELAVVEQMIASFKSQNKNEALVTPKNFEDYPLEK